MVTEKDERIHLHFEYEELEQLLIRELKKLRYGKLKVFCDNNNLTYKEVSRLRSGKLEDQRPYFFAEILKGLGYKKVLITHKITFDVEK